MSETFARAELFVVLLAAMLGLTALARRLLVPYPILLVLGGLAIAFIPGVPEWHSSPTWCSCSSFPILWGAAYFTSLRDFKRNLRSISGLAIGLVLLTTLVVGWVAHAIIPGMSWAVALCLGAIVSPPDAVAATAIMSRIGVPRTVISVLEGESLVNDATALVLYRAAVVAIVSGTFSLGATAGSFLLVAIVGVLVGVAVGWVTRWAVRHMNESYSQIALTLLAPYVAWIAAERLHSSAVLACVAGGLYVRQHFSAEVAPLVRVQARTVWELLIFLLNGVIFILIGLQLGPLRRTLSPSSAGQVLRWGVIITLTAIVVRLLWMPVGAAWYESTGSTGEEPAASGSFHLHRGLDRHARHRVARYRARPPADAGQWRADAVPLGDRAHHFRGHSGHTRDAGTDGGAARAPAGPVERGRQLRAGAAAGTGARGAGRYHASGRGSAGRLGPALGGAPGARALRAPPAALPPGRGPRPRVQCRTGRGTATPPA